MRDLYSRKDFDARLAKLRLQRSLESVSPSRVTTRRSPPESLMPTNCAMFTTVPDANENMPFDLGGLVGTRPIQP